MIKLRYRVTSVFISAGLLTACAATGGTTLKSLGPGDVSTVEVTRTLPLKYKKARVHIQGGEVIRPRSVDRFDPSCSIGLNSKRDNKRLISAINPGRFTIRDTRRRKDVSMSKPMPVQLASNSDSIPVLHIAAGGIGPSTSFYITEFRLYSEEQPQVYDLICSYDTGGAMGHYLSLDEMNDTLGNAARIY